MSNIEYPANSTFLNKQHVGSFYNGLELIGLMMIYQSFLLRLWCFLNEQSSHKFAQAKATQLCDIILGWTNKKYNYSS